MEVVTLTDHITTDLLTELVLVYTSLVEQVLKTVIFGLNILLQALTLTMSGQYGKQVMVNIITLTGQVVLPVGVGWDTDRFKLWQQFR